MFELLGFPSIAVFFVLVFGSVIRQMWRNAVERKEEVQRLLVMASEEAAMAEMEALAELESSVEYVPVVPAPKQRYQCAVCFRPTTTRCSRCKAVRYCSGKCQINHWRQGHKDECSLQIIENHVNEEMLSCRDSKQFDPHDHGFENEDSSSSPFEGARVTDDEKKPKHHRDTKQNRTGYASSSMSSFSAFTPSTARSDVSTDISHSEGFGSIASAKSEGLVFDGCTPDTPRPSTSVTYTKLSTFPGPESTSLDNSTNTSSRSSKLNKTKPSYGDNGVRSRLHSVANDVNHYSQVCNGKAVRPGPSKISGEHLFMVNGGLDGPVSRSPKAGVFNGLPVVSGEAPYSSLSTHNGLKTSVHKAAGPFQASKKPKTTISGNESEIFEKCNFKAPFPFELFVKLYFCNQVDLHPFGLVNYGNSCYANAVLQCLAFTRPLTSYLLRGIHSKSCQKEDWCFICEFECLILRGRQSNSPLLPSGILSQLQKIGSHLGHGRQEDAHEFLRYAVDTMQSSLIKQGQFVDSFPGETTLVGLTFGGYLRSKIKCMKCLSKSEQFEPMMDLTVEIGGNIRTLEEALAQFTAVEVLDGKNKFECKRCKSYQKAKKKLTILEAPNILTIVLKRFQSGDFGKLNKPIQFTEVLNVGSYMSEATDKSPLYRLYGVIVHLDFQNAAFSGHYVCYVKNLHGEWFKIDDSTVTPVKPEKVLSQGAYILLYARQSPRPPPLLKKNGPMVSHDSKYKRRSLEAIPTGVTTSKAKLCTEPSQQKLGKSPYQMIHDGPASNKSFDIEDWRLHSIKRFQMADSSSETSSSHFSCSDVGSCSTESTKDSDFSDYIFGEVGIIS